MTATVMTPASRAKPAAAGALDSAARLWFAAAVIGQMMFVYYIVAFYGLATLTGNFESWSKNSMLFKGYVPGDTAGNLAFGAHVLMAAVITFGGTVQMIPQIRARAPAVHRWTGRAFMVTAMGASLAGLYMTWIRGTSEALAPNIAITIDGVLILAFAALAWRAAVTRNFVSHRRWALRTFMVANGVWFLRLGFVTWGMLNKAVGVDKPDMETFFVIWNFGAYLVPLAILELYFLAQTRGGPRARLAMAGGLTAATALMSLGIIGLWFGMLAPILAKL